ncbi:iron-containing alcohol dehydrogenase [uncultured Marixanthomonas sp.]|uniref:iron-containing alcohol dehydrogenase n=1 Tax=uncultured Marixanthomonas sp. TaxID=757245 RepID=UPI0030DA05C9|tara:strand:- start:14630 stop:15778 length:1149 start_codon:yes stop_codon:yes gene_type:complete
MSVAKFKSAHEVAVGRESIQELKDYMNKLGMNNPFIVTDKGIRNSGTLEIVTSLLEDNTFTIYDHVAPEPEMVIVEACKKAFLNSKHDGIIAVGGGSVLDTAKIMAVYAEYDGPLASLFGEDKVPGRNTPIIVIPTTAGTGSEVTNIGILSDTQAQVKKGIVSNHLLVDVALVDPIMTLSCPKKITAASGIDALVHAIEAYLSTHSNEITDALSLKAMKLIINSLPKAYAQPSNIDAREDMAMGSLLAGMAFGNAGVGAVHALAYPLGGRFHISHGVSNSLLLPYVMEWNKMACVERFRDIAEAFDENLVDKTNEQAADLVITRLHKICSDVEIPQKISSFDIPESILPELAADAIQIDRLLRNNPRQLSEQDILAIYKSAY